MYGPLVASSKNCFAQKLLRPKVALSKVTLSKSCFVKKLLRQKLLRPKVASPKSQSGLLTNHNLMGGLVGEVLFYKPTLTLSQSVSQSRVWQCNSMEYKALLDLAGEVCASDGVPAVPGGVLPVCPGLQCGLCCPAIH